MLYSITAHKSGGTGFFFDGDKNAPADVIKVSNQDAETAVNLTSGMTYSFDATGKLVTAQPSAAEALNSAKADRLSALSAACVAQIYAGFTSSALGAPYTYPAKDKDQSNLVASVTASLVPGLPAGWTTDFWCADSAGVWALRPHTAAQIQKAGLDGKASIGAAIQKNDTLAKQVMAAITVAAVQAVVW